MAQSANCGSVETSCNNRSVQAVCIVLPKRRSRSSSVIQGTLVKPRGKPKAQKSIKLDVCICVSPFVTMPQEILWQVLVSEQPAAILSPSSNGSVVGSIIAPQPPCRALRSRSQAWIQRSSVCICFIEVPSGTCLRPPKLKKNRKNYIVCGTEFTKKRRGKMTWTLMPGWNRLQRRLGTTLRNWRQKVSTNNASIAITLQELQATALSLA